MVSTLEKASVQPAEETLALSLIFPGLKLKETVAAVAPEILDQVVPLSVELCQFRLPPVHPLRE
jgi:hypothetical protein